MKAGVLQKVDQLVLADVAKPMITEDDILVRVHAAAFCGTDIRIIRGMKTKGIRYPSIIGHEFSGDIVEVGKNVTSFQKGNRVTVDPVLPCGGCAYCLNGLENVCLNRKAIGYEFDGCFAEYILIPGDFINSGNVQLLPDVVSYEEGALAEPLSCVINGQRKLNITLGETILIIGAGPIGIMHLMIARASGGAKIIVSEPNEFRRNAAKEMGADLVIDPIHENLVEIVKDQTNTLGADVVILAIGNPRVVNDALNCARKGGRISMFAGFSKGDMPGVDVNVIHYNELVVVGASSLQRRDLKTAINLIASGSVHVKQLITKVFPLDQIAEAFDLAESGGAIKVVVKP